MCHPGDSPQKRLHLQHGDLLELRVAGGQICSPLPEPLQRILRRGGLTGSRQVGEHDRGGELGVGQERLTGQQPGDQPVRQPPAQHHVQRDGQPTHLRRSVNANELMRKRRPEDGG